MRYSALEVAAQSPYCRPSFSRHLWSNVYNRELDAPIFVKLRRQVEEEESVPSVDGDQHYYAVFTIECRYPPIGVLQVGIQRAVGQ